MKRFLLVGLGVVIAAFFFYQYVQNAERDRVQRAERDRAKEATLVATELHLSLRCNRNDIDTLLSANPDLFGNAGFNNVVAVIAEISAIRAERASKDDEGSKAIRVADGSCLRLLFVGRRISF